jgi:hypothetical protein
MLSGLGVVPERTGEVMAAEELKRRFDAVAENLAKAVRELAHLRQHLTDEFDRTTVGEMIADVGIAAEECLLMAHLRCHPIPKDPTSPRPDVCIEKREVEARFLDHEAIDAAMRKAVQQAVWEHKQLGYPIYAMKDGKMQWIPPQEIEVEKPQDD